MSKKRDETCRLKKQGFAPGSCRVDTGGKYALACQTTLKRKNNAWYRLITSAHLSRPENYLSVYQSGCNFSCKKCHSWYFSKVKDGTWHSPKDILRKAIEYDKKVTLRESRDRATAWHAHDSCRCCGSCVLHGKRSDYCPGLLDPESIVLSPQGFGPARNVLAFTGGDLTCCPEFYGECAQLTKDQTSLWFLIETNGHGLTPHNLDYLRDSGVDGFWLDIKAHDTEKHKWLTGCPVDHILKLPEEMVRRDFVLEVLSLYIPGVVETDELLKIARVLTSVDPTIPFTILAFFPEHLMQDFKSPSVEDMVGAYESVRGVGLSQVRLGNVGVFARTEEDREYLMACLDETAY